MKTDNFELMSQARTSLSGKWTIAVVTFLLYGLISGIGGGASQFYPSAIIITLIIGGPLQLGIYKFSLSISRNQDARLEQIFDGFYNFGNALAAFLLILVFTILWSLLLIIPGIIAAISYSMTFFIMADNPDIDPMEAIDKSKAMMRGYKWKYFELCLIFFVLILLSLLTLGIALLWLIPFMQITYAKFYEDIKEG